MTAIFNAIVSPLETASRLFKKVMRRYRASMFPVFDRYLPSPARLSRLPLIGGIFASSTDVDEWLTKTALKLLPAKLTIKTTDEEFLVTGDREAYARAILPPEQYPELWYHVPADMKRPLVEDGRCIDGRSPADALAGNTVTIEFVSECQHEATAEAIFWAVTVFVVGMGISGFLLLLLSGLMNAYSIDPQKVLSQMDILGWDQWPGETAPNTNFVERVQTMGSIVSRVLGFAFLVGGMALSAVAVAIVSFGFGLAMWFWRFAGLVSVGIGQATAALRSFESEAIQRYGYRLEQNKLERIAYRKALKTIAEFDGSPLLDLGKATGVFGFRGKLGAPEPGQQMVMSMIDLLQHMLVLGSSGEGKTRNLLRVVMLQLAMFKKQGYPLAIFAMDDKSVLHNDLKGIAEQVGIDSFRVIGVEEGQFQVDLLKDTSPTHVAEIMESCAQNMAGEGGKGDAFWSQMASQLVLEVATLLRTWELTDVGRAWVRREGYRAYSLRNILRVCQSDAIILSIIEDINSAILDDEQFQVIQHTLGLGLWSAIESQQTAWAELAANTKSGVLASARQALRLFAFNEVISRGFGDGAGKNLLSPKDLHGNFFTGVAISAIEHGSAGKLVLIALKSLYQMHARAMDAQDPQASGQRLKWWGKPDLTTAYASEAHRLSVFICDEYQGLATKDDESFAAVARSTGTCLIFSTQSLSAIESTLGKTSTAALVSNLRTKLFLRSEDLETIAYANKLAGKTLRLMNKLDENIESYRAAALRWGIDLENLELASIETLREISRRVYTNQYDAEALYEGLFSNSIVVAEYGLLNPRKGGKSPYDAQIANEIWWYEMVNQKELTLKGLNGRWRAGIDGSGQDVRKTSPEYREANEKPSAWTTEDLLSAADMQEMGRGRSEVFIQRGGITRSDIIQLNEPIETEFAAN